MELAVGMKVQWTHVSTGRRTMSMTLREGTIEAINGNVATVRTPSRKLVDIDARRLQPVGAQSQIGQFVEAMREAHTQAPAE